MADNKRFVSYMYEYKGDEKGCNTGYARVDARGSQCKILVHISQKASEGRLLKAYMFYRKPGKYRFAYLGNILMIDGTGELKVKADRENVMNSDLGLDQFCGVIAYDSGRTYFACEWDEEPITHSIIDHIDNLDLSGSQEVVLGGSSESSMNETNEEHVAEEEIVSKEEIKSDGKVDDRDTLEISMIPVQELETVSEEEIIAAQALAEQKGESEQEDNSAQDIAYENQPEPEIPQAELELHAAACLDVECVEPTYGTCGDGTENQMQHRSLKDTACRYECHPAAQNIFRKFPRVYPFEDHEICDCVCIEPKDIGLFPIDAWVLGNNSFLLHGYYTYKHLIFGKIHTTEGIIYVLGVPGVYQSRESFMARMFGFEYFKCAKATERRNGEFGYYYQPIQFQ